MSFSCFSSYHSLARLACGCSLILSFLCVCVCVCVWGGGGVLKGRSVNCFILTAMLLPESIYSVQQIWFKRSQSQNKSLPRLSMAVFSCLQLRVLKNKLCVIYIILFVILFLAFSSESNSLCGTKLIWHSMAPVLCDVDSTTSCYLSSILKYTSAFQVACLLSLKG